MDWYGNMGSWSVWLILTSIIVLILQMIVDWMWRAKKLPPGPWGVPFIGSLFWLGLNPHLNLTRMSKVYGDIITITFGSYTSIALNSIESVRETLVKHSRVYAGRPQLYSLTEVRAGLGILFIDFCPKYERQRKLTIRSLHRTFYQTYKLDDILDTEATKLVREFGTQQDKPFNPKSFLRLLATNVILKSFFDADFEFNGEEPREVVKMVDEFTRTTSPVNLSDIIPWLQKLPISNYEKIKKMFQDFIDMHERFYKQAKQGRKAGFPRCLTDALLDNLDMYNKAATDQELKNSMNDVTSEKQSKISDKDSGIPRKHLKHSEDDLNDSRISEKDSRISKKDLISENDLVYVLADLVGAAFETIANTLSWALLLIAAHPDWQTALQSELDAVVGRRRLPCLNDRDMLPTVNAALYEVLRMSCVVPISLPHSTTQRVQLREFDIPKGTFVFVNLWALHHDPRYWTSPHEFNPRRFLDKNGSFVIPKHQSFLPFSTGGRSCLGERLAKDEIFVFFSAILQRFRLYLASDVNDLDFNGEYRLTLEPKHYLLKVEQR